MTVLLSNNILVGPKKKKKKKGFHWVNVDRVDVDCGT
jgi:hypothetical protein